MKNSFNFIQGKQKLAILISSMIIIVLLILAWLFFGTLAKQEVSMEEPIDIVLDFYDQWLVELKSSDTDPYQSGLAKSAILSKELRQKIKNAKGHSETELDPVLCQTTSDIEIGTRTVHEQEDEVQFVVTARDQELTGQAIVTLLKYNDGWFIDNVTCAPGESGPLREFTFEKEGYLLKDSVPAPLNPEYWYLIFEENEQPGHSVPLFFDTESMCLYYDKKEEVCDPNRLEETNKALVRGEMTESGVEVKYFELVKE
ncbi:MAG: hypothetical protein WDZ73_01645 [Candidatus Paceibacterota bacterium]